MYSPRLYKYRDISVLYTPTVQLSVPYHTRTLLWYRHKQMTSPPPGNMYGFRDLGISSKGIRYNNF